MSITLNRIDEPVAIVKAINLAESAAGRLKALGVFEGQRIEIARRGNPLIVKAAGSRIAIAEGLAKDILVENLVDG